MAYFAIIEDATGALKSTSRTNPVRVAPGCVVKDVVRAQRLNDVWDRTTRNWKTVTADPDIAAARALANKDAATWTDTDVRVALKAYVKGL